MAITKPEETICYKVDQMLAHLEKAVKTRSLSPVGMAEALHDIRHKAQRMEDAIKLRKKVMATVPGMEEEYQKQKGKRKVLPKGNHLGGIDETREKGEMNLQFIVLDNGKEVYNVKSKGGVLATVEEFAGIDDVGCIEGRAQLLTWGHPLSVWFAFDQLRSGTEDIRMKTGTDIESVIKRGLLNDPDEKNRLIKMLNKTQAQKAFWKV